MFTTQNIDLLTSEDEDSRSHRYFDTQYGNAKLPIKF